MERTKKIAAITAEPFIRQRDGALCWRLRQGGIVATIDAATGEVVANGEKSREMRTLLGALWEHYQANTAGYAGENARKLRAELRAESRRR